jgi:hypothetical protein
LFLQNPDLMRVSATCRKLVKAGKSILKIFCLDPALSSPSEKRYPVFA